jgi:hypothetical protein
MNVYDLVEKLNGEICRGRARVRVDGQIVVVGQLNGDYMEFTEAGRNLAEPAQEAAKSEEVVVESKQKRGRPTKPAVVESDTFTADLFSTEQGLT